MRDWADKDAVARWIKSERDKRGWSQGELARRLTGLFQERTGMSRSFSQQTIAQAEGRRLKSVPEWSAVLEDVFAASDAETKEDAYLSMGATDRSVDIRRMATFVGLGGGGSGEGDMGVVSFSRDLIENELRAPADALLAMVAEGNSMEPDFRGGDQILVDTRRKSLAQPGAFCLWDGDGHVVKFLEKVPGSEPAAVRVISLNAIYEPQVRLVEEINLVGRVVWFGRRVQ